MLLTIASFSRTRRNKMSSRTPALFFFLMLATFSLGANDLNNDSASATPQTKTNCEKTFPRNCREVQNRGFNISDIYYIQPDFSPVPFPVMCEMKTRGGGWVYFMNRLDGSEDFYLGWDRFKEGFGNLAGEFWLGLEKLHLLTGYESNELLIEIVDWDNQRVDAHYNTFTIGNEKEGYILRVLEGFTGSAGDSFRPQGGMRFTTKDKDLDLWHEGNCADWSKGAWWHRSCKSANLLGIYYKQDQEFNDYTGMYWSAYRGDTYSCKQARMMVRPRTGRRAILQPSTKFAN